MGFQLTVFSNEMILIKPNQDTSTAKSQFGSLKAYYIDKNEVTIGDYFNFVSQNAFKGYRGYKKPNPEGRKKAVTRIHFFDAFKYCDWKGKTLPTEAEWEYAATRGKRSFPWGEGAVNGKRANYCDLNCPAPWSDFREDDHYKRIAPVGSYPLGNTPDGIADMAGNLWEMTRTIHNSGKIIKYQKDKKYSREMQNQYIVIKGGSYGSKAEHLKSNVRRPSHVTFRSSHVGFRCIKYYE